MRRFRSELILLLFAGVLLPFNIQQNHTGDSPFILAWRILAEPGNEVGNLFQNWWTQWRKDEGAVKDLTTQNKQLRQELLLQKIRFAESQDHLHSLLEARALNQRVLPTPWKTVLSRGRVRRDTFLRPSLSIQAGIKEGVKGDELVVSSLGVLGLTRSGAAFSNVEVITLLEPGCRLSVKLKKSNVVGLMEGRRDALAILWCPRGKDIRPGDIWVTSGLDGLAPSGLPVAKTQEVNPRADGFLDIRAQPLADFSTVELVAILFKP